MLKYSFIFSSRAGIYTTEEVVRITLEKLVRLRSKYVEYLNVLNRRLEIGEKLNAQKIKENPNHNTMACNSYVSCQGKEAFRALKLHGRLSRRERLLRKFHEDGKSAQRGIKSLCVFCDENGTTCQNESLINSTYCKSHILQDSDQIMYAHCLQEGCCEIVLRMNEKCVGHSKLF
uniref:KAT8 regulatory NSL complex subunit 2 n=1 Tax=Romanomermis culicivorax TaxID=13658 RepID=A0A915I049_ROMCU